MIWSCSIILYILSTIPHHIYTNNDPSSFYRTSHAGRAVEPSSTGGGRGTGGDRQRRDRDRRGATEERAPATGQGLHRPPSLQAALQHSGGVRIMLMAGSIYRWICMLYCTRARTLYLVCCSVSKSSTLGHPLQLTYPPINQSIYLPYIHTRL